MADYIKIFDKLAGLQNNIPEYRLSSPDYGQRDPGSTVPLARAQDVLIDNSGSAYVRPGYVLKDAAVWHSLFCDGGDAVGVRGQNLMHIDASAATPVFRPLASGLNARTSYAQVNDEIYYTCGEHQGRVVAGRHHGWLDMPGVPYDTNRQFVQRIPAKLIAFHLSRIWLANDNFVVFSEPLGFSLFDLHESSILFDDAVVMLRPVEGGIFISTTKKVYFLGGNEPNGLDRKVAAHAPALPWSCSNVLVEAVRLGLDPELGKVALWVGEDGVYAGLKNGVAVNITEAMVEFPAGYGHGASAPFREHLFMCIDKQ